jgi:hypothetical protein
MATPDTNSLASEASPASALLLACSRTTPDSAAVRRIRELLGAQLDWEYLIGLARRHRVTPLVYWNLHTICAEDVPPAAMQLFRETYRSSAQKNLLLAAELLKILNLLDSNAIPVLPLKGPTLAVLAYDNLSLRPFEDLDILVREQDVVRVKQLLVSNGYQTELGLSGSREAAFLRSQYEYHFERADSKVVIGLHYRVRPRHFGFELTPETLWERRETMALFGQQVWCLAMEDQILTLCAHGTYHCWETLSWICDIAQLLRIGTNLNWVRLVDRAKALGSERMLMLGLLLAHDLLEAPVPVAVAGQLRADTITKALAHQVCDALFGANFEAASVVKAGWFHLKARERIGDKIRYCLLLTLLPTAEDWALLPLPAALAFIYSLLRPFRLAGTYSSGLLKHLAIWQKS